MAVDAHHFSSFCSLSCVRAVVVLLRSFFAFRFLIRSFDDECCSAFVVGSSFLCVTVCVPARSCWRSWCADADRLYSTRLKDRAFCRKHLNFVVSRTHTNTLALVSSSAVHSLLLPLCGYDFRYDYFDVFDGDGVWMQEDFHFIFRFLHRNRDECFDVARELLVIWSGEQSSWCIVSCNRKLVCDLPWHEPSEGILLSIHCITLKDTF